MGAVARRRVMVLDGNERAALAATRSLVRAGHAVLAVGRSRFTLAGIARGAQSAVVRADPLADARGYAADVATLADAWRAEVLLPVTDASVEALLEHRDCIDGRIALPFPTLAAYRLASDKVTMLGRARDAGLAVPDSEVIEHAGDIERAIERAIARVRYPVVLKPHRSVAQGADGIRRKLSVLFAANAAELRAAAGALPACAFPLLVQHRVRGPGEGVFALRWGGATVALFAHRRLREKPPAGGVSVYRESIQVDPALAAAATHMLGALDWQGVAMIECKRDAATGRHVFMEVNGRLWGSLQLAIDAGLDFPAILVACATGSPPPANVSFTPGIRTRWFWGDVDHLYLRMLKNSRALHLEGGEPSRWAVLRDFFRVRPRQDHAEIWRWRDPGPAVLETVRRLLPAH
jgi:predicted ATP-grasp superfamily ATP-dependent carboligase